MGLSAADITISLTLIANAILILASRMPEEQTEGLSFFAKIMNVSEPLNYILLLVTHTIFICLQRICKLRRYSLVCVVWNIIFVFLVIVVFPSD